MIPQITQFGAAEIAQAQLQRRLALILGRPDEGAPVASTARDDQPIGAQLPQRFADGHRGHPKTRGQIRLGRQQRPVGQQSK